MCAEAPDGEPRHDRLDQRSLPGLGVVAGAAGVDAAQDHGDCRDLVAGHGG
jgi:hypothetical protein